MREDLHEKAALDTIKYFSFFNYPPDFWQIHKYLPVKCNYKKLSSVLRNLMKKRKILSSDGYEITEKDLKQMQYALPPHRKYFKRRLIEQAISEKKEKLIDGFIKIVSFFPQIKLIGFSGSIAIKQAKQDDDIDLFVISARNRLWTCRAICLLIASVLGKRRKFKSKKTSDKLCLNLFFDCQQMTIPVDRRNLYTAHEVLQMRPIAIRGGVYRQFMQANKWVISYCPNATYAKSESVTIIPPGAYLPNNFNVKMPFFPEFLEKLLMVIQMYFIKKHKTKEYISSRQLWFFPDDFSAKLKKKGII